MPQTWGGRRPERVVSSLARQRPQQAAGGGEEVDGGGAVGDEGRLQPESLEHLHLPDRPQPIRAVQGLQREAHVLIGCCQVTWSTQDDQGPKQEQLPASLAPPSPSPSACRYPDSGPAERSARSRSGPDASASPPPGCPSAACRSAPALEPSSGAVAPPPARTPGNSRISPRQDHPLPVYCHWQHKPSYSRARLCRAWL